MDTRNFRRVEIDQVLREVSAGLARPLEGYIIGGLAMMYHGVKLATKDVDLVFRTRRETGDFIHTLERLGFADIAPQSSVGTKRKSSWRMRRPDGMRFDVFQQTVCDCLAVTETMSRRTAQYASIGALSLKVISPEDIFLLKSVTDRDDDLADMRLLAGMGLDWGIIEQELKSQPDYWNWVAHHYVKLGELEERYHIRSPLKRHLAGDAEIAAGIARLRYELVMRPLTIQQARHVLKERTGKFGAAILEKMVELGMARKQGERYFLLRGHK